MKKFLIILTLLFFLRASTYAQCPPGAFAYQSLYPQCSTGCGVLLLGWPEGVLVNIYGGTPLVIVNSALISGTLGNGGTGDAFTCVPCNIPLVYAAASPGASSGCVIATIGIVPVKLVDFSVTNSAKKGSEIKWTTTQELEPVKYIIQRSQNSRNYLDIATLNGKQQPNNQYNFTDDYIKKGIVYYRVKVKEAAGQIFYSSVSVINNQIDFSVIAYPNPVDNKFKLTIPQQLLPATYQIINALGQTVYSASTQTITTEINQLLTAGIYAIRVKGRNNEIASQTIIKK